MSNFEIRTCFIGAASNISSRDLRWFPSEAWWIYPPGYSPWNYCWSWHCRSRSCWSWRDKTWAAPSHHRCTVFGSFGKEWLCLWFRYWSSPCSLIGSSLWSSWCLARHCSCSFLSIRKAAGLFPSLAQNSPNASSWYYPLSICSEPSEIHPRPRSLTCQTQQDCHRPIHVWCFHAGF